MRLKQRLLVLPEGTDIVSFVQHDGNPPAIGPTLPHAPRQAITLGTLRDRYLATHGNGTIEANSLDTCKLHLAHFCRVFGDAFPLHELSLAKLQEYVNRRAKEKISPITIRKEIATLRAAWNWGGPMDLTSGNFLNRGLRYPKADDKPPFMTCDEIERQVKAGGDPDVLWDALYLQTTEIDELLAQVKAKDSHSWIYPLFAFAAHTGARRSEIIRALVADVDFKGNTVLIREKKRARGKRTTRRVPLTPLLNGVLKDWLNEHPGGPFLFCHGDVVSRSKRRSPTTGHKGEKTRASGQKDRMATIRQRSQPAASALTRNEVHDHFKRTLASSKWDVIRGLHCLRHSFISACASKGVDQRLVQEWCGHMTAEMSRRYAHLYPSTQQEAIKRVFGKTTAPRARSATARRD
jgi:integrase